jgi:glycosyltransferase involved in cell wall biosynthesis
MKNNSPLISFCVPTYNREKYLIKSLDSIISQIDDENKRKKIEIIVSNNCSTDRTAEIAESYRLSFPNINITVINNNSNLGMDGNFLNCYKNSNGKYTCLISDDDFLLDGSVSYIINTLESNPSIDGIFLNPFPIAGCSPEKEVIIHSKDDMLDLIGNRLVHLGALLFKTEIFLKNIYDRHTGSFLVISYVFLDVLNNGNGIQFTKRKFYDITQNNSGGYNFFDVFITSYYNLLDHASSIGFSYGSIIRARHQHLRHFIIPFAIDFRLNDSYIRMKRDFKEGFKMLLSRHGFRPIIFWGVIPAFFAPLILWRIVRFTYRFIKSLDRHHRRS